MNLHSTADVRGWCIENGFHPNKTLGQNFLTDANALAAIADASGAKPGDRVLEVGPGLGALTETLLRRGVRVFAVEKDCALAARLENAFPEFADSFEIVCGDALRMAEEGALDGFGMCVSNLPYSCGTRIMLELAARPAPPDSFTVLVQTEVAERLAAGPGSKTRGFAGVRMQLDYTVEIVREVAPSCFWPKPAVGSSVVRMERKPGAASLPAAVRRTLVSMAKTAFNHRRKQLGTIFRGIVRSCARPEELSNEEWLELAAATAAAHPEPSSEVEK